MKESLFKLNIALAFKKYNVLIKNLGLLSVVKIVNLILPLIVYPYLIRILGSENYGLIIYAEAIITYFVIMISYGFNLSATKEIAIHRDNKDKIIEIVSSVYSLKFIFFIISSVFLLVTFYLSPIAYNNKLLFSLTMYMCLYEFLLPLWYYQGVERLGPITTISLIGKIIFFICIFVIIKAPEDYILVPLINGVCLVFPIIFLVVFLFKHEKLVFKLQSKEVLMKYLKESSLYFTSFFSVQVLTNTNKFLIGSFVGIDKLAYYDIAEKIIRILSVPTAMLRQVLLPYVANTKNKIIVRYTTIAMSLFSIILVCVLFLISTEIVQMVIGFNSIETNHYFRIYMPILILYNLGNYYLVVSFNAFNFERLFLNIILSSLLTYLIAVLLVVILNISTIENFIYCLLLAESILVIRTLNNAYKHNLL